MGLLKACILANYKILYFLAFTLIFFGCETKPSPKAKTSTTQKKPIVKKKKVKKKQDLTVYPNTRTAVEFFTEYGKKNPETHATIQTSFGNIELELFKDTPLHRASFVYLVKEGYFDLTSFHRVVPDFIIQGGNGDTEAVANFKNKRKNYKIPPEFRTNHPHKRGALAAAREWEYNPEKLTTPFEFYIILGVDDYRHLNGEHTVFGQVLSGMSVVDAISKVETSKDEWPIDNVNMKITVR